MEANPYSTPTSNPYGAVSTIGEDAVSPGTIAQLAGTKPWVRFLSVLMWIGTVFMILASVGLIIAGVMGIGAGSNNNGLAAMGGFVAMGVFYGVMTLLILYPTLKMSKYATCIGRLLESRSVADLESALTEQRRFWKFYGILMVIYLCFIVVAIVASLVIPGVMMMNKPGGM